MAEQNQPEIFFAGLQQKVEAYISNRLLLFALQSIKKISKLITGLVVGLIVIFLLFFMLLFLGVAAGFYFSHITHNAFYGFGIVAGIYLFLFLMIIFFRKALIEKPIKTLIIKTLFDK